MLVPQLLGLLAVASAAIVGIDFGQQFTKAMMVAPGIPFEIIFTDDGKRKDTLALFLRPAVEEGALVDAERKYGSQIGSLCSRFPESCVSSLKLLLGLSVEDPAALEYARSHFGIELVPSETRNGTVAVKVGLSPNTATFDAEELAAMSLADLKARVLKALVHHPNARPIADDVAVAILPFANQVTRLAYYDALGLAGFSSVLALVDEGSAAALGYVSGRKFAPEDYNDQPVYHVIYDMGAGSTTATLFSHTALENKTVVVDVLSVGYDEAFGGQLLTNLVYDNLYAKFLDHFKLDDSFKMPPRMAAKLTATAEAAKIILSANSDYRVSLESFYDSDDFKATITRQEFEEAAEGLQERAIKPLEQALQSANMTLADVKSVILNGGSTRTPFIQKLLSEFVEDKEKIARTLNTDEACALGTTIRAYQVKLGTGYGSNYVLRERSLSNFSYAVDGTEFPMFSEGTVAGNLTKVLLGSLTNETTITLLENGKPFAEHKMTNLSRYTTGLSCDDDGHDMYATFKLDTSKMFKLSHISVKCKTSKPKNVINMDSAVNGSIDFSSWMNKEKDKFSAKVPLPSAKFTNLRPLSSSEKRAIVKQLEALTLKEQEKLAVEELRNLLESQCYSLRSYIDKHFDVLKSELGEEKLDEHRQLASDTVEWLEYESDEATLEDVKSKLDNLEELRLDLEKKVKMASADLSMLAFQKVLSQGNEVAQQVQDYLLEFGTQVKSIRDKYDAESFDFDSENNKIMTRLYGGKQGSDMMLDQHFSAFKDALKDLTEIVALSEEEFEALAKTELYDTLEIVKLLLKDMLDDVESLQNLHEKRIDFLTKRMDKLRERKIQKQFKAKLKDEKETASAEPEESLSVPVDEDSKATEESHAEESGKTENTSEENEEEDDEEDGIIEEDDEDEDVDNADSSFHDEL